MIDDINDDIDALITELNASGGIRQTEGVLRVQSLLTEVVQQRGSDLLLVAGSAPGIRIDGAIVRMAGPALDGFDIEEVVVPLLPPHAKRQFQKNGITDASVRLPEVGRF